jgi:hypothetical protein
VVRLFFCDASESYLAHIDTACSFDIVLDEYFPDAGYFNDTGVVERAILASGESRIFRQMTTTIEWLGTRRIVRVYQAAPMTVSGTNGSAAKRTRRSQPEGSPQMLIGVPLLETTEVCMNFASNRVTIKSAA